MKHAREDYSRIQDPTGKIPEDEPVFLLRGQDKYAAQVVEYWTWLVAMGGGSTEIVDMAHNHAVLMENWPIKKRPDLP